MEKQRSNYIFKTKKGLNESIVREISQQKSEPSWMLDLRLKSLKHFESTSMPDWGPSLKHLDTNDLHYFIRPIEKQQSSWSEVPEDIRNTFDKLGVPESERKYLAGMGAQYESEMVYHNLQEKWKQDGVIFLDCESGLQEYPEIFKKYFGSVVPYHDNKFSALNTAVWSGGSFVYVPRGVNITMPLQTYFRINSKQLGQFERTLIIAEEGSFVHYIEGCTAPTYNLNSLHSAVVEIIAKPGSHVRYSTIQNWSTDVFNIVTKRGVAYKDSLVEWVDGNLGSGITMKYPCVILKEPGARVDFFSIAMASQKGQVQDSGGKAIHLASNTSSKIISKSISKNGGRCSYRGAVKIKKDALNCKSYVQCDSLILDDHSRADAYPYMDINEHATVNHEAKVSKIEEEQLFYLMCRGINANDAKSTIVNGFIEPFVRELPMEFAVEMNRLIELELDRE